jgi:hypothetical protein
LVHLPWVLNGNVSSFPVRQCFHDPNDDIRDNFFLKTNFFKEKVKTKGG